ncbi:MAG TPA: hypothetical protein V6D47_18670 [Oscillatoriaceae cyanobacterium]
MTLAPDALEALPLLSEADCAAACAQVHALQPYWVARHPEAPFYTLGAASYLDGSAGNRYAALATRLNPHLDSAFAPLYARVCATLAARLGEPVQLAGTHARPGFHVFLAHEAFARPVARLHCDLQHELLPWDGAIESTLSFTLPVALPASGGGMEVWAIDTDAWLALELPERKAALTTLPRRDVTYTLGTLALHSGRLLHRIAPSAEVAPQDERITLQGHGVRIAGTWHLYW